MTARRMRQDMVSTGRLIPATYRCYFAHAAAAATPTATAAAVAVTRGAGRFPLPHSAVSGAAVATTGSRDGSARLIFIQVADSKAVKNRVHLDLEPVQGRRDDELDRLLTHGAVAVADHRGKYGPGTGWVVLADPEGNEFCILRNTAERSI